MDITKIIYDTTRGLLNLEDKLNISTIFIFCYEKDSELFAELLYTENHNGFIKKMNDKFKEYEVKFDVNLNDKNIKECFYKTIEEVKKKYDENEFFKALFEKDEFALVINEIVKTKF